MIIMDDIDTKILNSLSKKSNNPSLLAKELSIPRTSISYRLLKLKKIHKINSFIVGRKTMWCLNLNKTHSKSLFQIYEDYKFLECYKQINTLKRNSFVYVIQGKNAAQAELINIPEELILNIHKTIKKKHITMKAITNQLILEEFLNLSKKLKESHINRQQNIKLIDKIFISSGELFVTDSYISITNPKKRKGVIIKDKDIVIMFYDLMRLLFSLSDKLENFDLNSYIRKTIK